MLDEENIDCNFVRGLEKKDRKRDERVDEEDEIETSALHHLLFFWSIDEGKEPLVFVALLHLLLISIPLLHILTDPYTSTHKSFQLFIVKFP